MTLYVIACTAVLAALEIWTWANLKTTLVWWLTFACSTLFSAHQMSDRPGSFRQLFLDAINWTAVVLFIAEFGAFPLWVELLMVPVLTFIGLVIAMIPSLPNTQILQRPFGCLQSIAGLAILLGGLAHAIANFSEFASLSSAREFGVPIALSVLYIPFIYLLATWMSLETMFVGLSIRTDRKDGGKLVRYARQRALAAFGTDLDGTRRLVRTFKQDNLHDRRSVDEAIRLIKRLKRIERNPPHVPAAEGWSPYAAMSFLSDYGVTANDWHPAFDEWRAEASGVKLSERPLADRVSYYISGVEGAATKLGLTLNADLMNETTVSDERFFEMVTHLLSQSFDADETQELMASLKESGSALSRSGKTLSLTQDRWGTDTHGGYSRRFIMLHEAHLLNRFDDQFYITSPQ